jgi:hypothetical protein
MIYWMRLRALAAISACTVFSCSAIASFDGLAGDGADGGPSVDGSTAVTTDGSTHADATTAPDANVAMDTGAKSDANGGTDGGGSTDGGNAVDGTTFDAGPTGFCAKHPGHTFCDDFDEVGLANWTPFTGNGTVGLDTVAFISPPNGVVGFSPAPDAGVDTLNDVAHNLTTASLLSAEAAFKVEGATNGCDFIAFSFYPNQATYKTCYVDLSFDISGGVIVESDCNGGTMPDFYQTTSLAAARPNGNRYSLTADLVNATLTGATGASSASVPLPSGLTMKGIWTLGVGVLYNAQSGTCTVHVDDVFADSK